MLIPIGLRLSDMVEQISQSASNGQPHADISGKRKAWQRKRMLREVYFDFYRRIAARLTGAPGLTVELGSGLGTIKEVIPTCITSDLFSNTWLDRRENAYKLSFASESVANPILFDVWHHLQFPGTALKEFERVLRKKGRLILFEPEMGLLGKLIYSLAHPGPVALNRPLGWFASSDFQPHDARYFAGQSSAHRVFVLGEFREMLDSWEVVEVCRLSSLAYLLSGGFGKPKLCPSGLLPLLNGIDRVLSRAPSLFAVRLLVVLEKRR
jgi:SAM-dependent methyltransferase